MKPNFKSGVRFGEKIMGCKMGKIKVVMNKPVYLGQMILDLSKIVTCKFHYDYIAPKYGKKLDLLRILQRVSRLDSIRVVTILTGPYQLV